MYETYVPIRVERKPPTIAEIVRQKTDDGARIIDFFLDLMEGRVEDAQLCHRIDAAKQLVKYGYKKAADFIAEHGDEPCDHCESRKRGPRPRKDASPAAGPLHAPGPYGYDFLTMLTEDFLTVVSAVDEDLMIKLVRAQTRDGGTVIDFLDAVMHGREDGFKVNHRIAAARELISHILRDEHATAYAVLDNVGPVLSTVEGADPRVRLLPSSETPSPVGAGFKPALPGPASEPNKSPSVVPAKAGTQRGGEGRRSHPILVHPEPVEEPALSLPKGPRPDFTGGAADNPSVVPAKAGTQRGSEGPTASELETLPRVEERKDKEPAPAEPVRAEQSVKQKLEAHRHEPDPRDRPIDSTNPGRAPPW